MLPLDSILFLTRGEMLGVSSLLSHLNPVNATYTGVCAPEDGLPTFLGQIRYPLGSRSAHLVYLAPRSAQESPELPLLIEHLTTQAGYWGAYHLLAEVEEHSGAFGALRQAAFSIYAWQRIWKHSAEGDKSPEGNWRPANPLDSVAVGSLYQSVVPGLVQPVEALTSSRLRGLVCRRQGELLAYADLVYGPRGIWVQPFIHPTTPDAAGLLVDLLRAVPHRRGRPVYLCVRSYQAWLESALEELDLEVGPRQAVLVKHLAVTKRAVQPLRVPVLENGHAEPTAPLVHVKSSKSDGPAR